MFLHGLDRLILQKRGCPEVPYETERDFEHWLMLLPADCREHIWVRGNPDLVSGLDVRGCVTDADTLMGPVPERWKSIDCVAFCRSLDQLPRLPEWVSGALVGPVFQPQSVFEKVDSLGTSLLAEKMRESKVPVIAFGGIDHDNLDEIGKLPLQGVSVLGGVWNYADPVNAFIKMQRALAAL